ncbi:hypothetical protein B7486_72055 [cyanobacterium TDX16]|nr:hypothetical protein B7486_72055 [cyanobacterium TDX16]
MGDQIVATTPGVAPGSATLRTVVALPDQLDAQDQLTIYGVGADGTLHPLVEERAEAQADGSPADGG